MNLDKERMTAVAAVRKACEICRVVQQTLVDSDTLSKQDRSPVTIADFSVQALVNHHLTEIFPEDPIIGEETSAALRKADNVSLKEKVVDLVQRRVAGITAENVLNSIDLGCADGGAEGRFWSLDPIDGTKGFLRQGQYAVALSLIVNGEVQLGVLGCPNMRRADGMKDNGLGRMFIAVRGESSFEMGFGEDITEWKMSVDAIEDPSRAVFCESVESGHSSQSDSAKVASMLGVTAPPVRIDSQCKYGVVAHGEASIYLRLPTRGISGPDRYIERIWDHAAGALIIEESGGKVTDIFGKSLNFGLGRGLEDNVGVIVTNGFLHAQVLNAVQHTLGIDN